jgi:hypothetical protein
MPSYSSTQNTRNLHIIFHLEDYFVGFLPLKIDQFLSIHHCQITSCTGKLIFRYQYCICHRICPYRDIFGDKYSIQYIRIRMSRMYNIHTLHNVHKRILYIVYDSKQISEVEEKSFTSSLNICPES